MFAADWASAYSVTPTWRTEHISKNTKCLHLIHKRTQLCNWGGNLQVFQHLLFTCRRLDFSFRSFLLHVFLAASRRWSRSSFSHPSERRLLLTNDLQPHRRHIQPSASRQAGRLGRMNSSSRLSYRKQALTAIRRSGWSEQVHAELLMVVLRDELLNVGQLVVQIFTANFVLVVVWVGLRKRKENNTSINIYNYKFPLY